MKRIGLVGGDYWDLGTALCMVGCGKERTVGR